MKYLFLIFGLFVLFQLGFIWVLLGLGCLVIYGKLTKIMMESQTGNMEDAPEEVYAYYNLLIDASLGLEE